MNFLNESASCIGLRLSVKVDSKKIKQYVKKGIQDDFLVMRVFFVSYQKKYT